MSDLPVAGEKAPAFKAESHLGPIDLDTLKGKNVVLYFYPKDNTPGCTVEAQDFRDRYEQFQALNTEIIGVSRDSLKTHTNFSNKHELPFPLIADPEEQLCNQFGVMKLKNMYGKQVRGIERSTFLINSQGILVKEWRGLKVPGHADKVLEAIKEIV
ncbi:peroxiredoxin [Advenella alkanexedens]|uniref:peroxiredoxin n=1 Tax=Advenella alkanexedens TaxID=1481665 RepID=UPI002675EF31|nr:peroxiredoxin [Advenella alkanexedens]WKU20662.1 peroxiredoxin [Advenella alkanexedens]